MPDSNPVLHFLHALPGDHERFPREEQAVLDLINQKVAAAASLDDLMDFLFDTIRALYPCDRIGLSFLEDEGRRVTAHWTRALYEPVHLKKGYSEDISRSSLRTVLESGSPRIIYDLAAYLEEHPRSVSSGILVREGVRSSLTCALSVEDRPVGLLFLSSREPRSYTPYHVRLWRLIAERLSQAVEKAWRIEQLTAANQAYTEVLGFVSHELKNPVASMITDARVLSQGYLGPMEPRQTAKLEKLIRKGEYLLDLVRNYLDLARMEGGTLRVAPAKVDLVSGILEPAIDLVLPQVQEKKQVLERMYPPTPFEVEVDPALLKIVLVNFVGNASKYGNEGGLIRVRAEREAAGFRVSVYNEGPGWPPGERVKLFRKFGRLQTPELRTRKGTGLGLYTSWRIVHLHGGHIDAQAEHGRWAEFTAEIPQPLPRIPDPSD
ncbi:MAG TPA: GAF domain-containing sensor histidine kinase [Holophaga sp.]|nr:GAF domain-containing sensor histidine kinase [Holophaga sp.]HPS67396.1 GAF domain-containing sensor histidine kinase [Holophaga sp.]